MNHFEFQKQCQGFLYFQGPGEDTTPAFWSMIWQYDIRVVVMLTNLVEGGGFTCIKCNMYWPESVGDTKRFGDIEVQLFDKAEVCTHTSLTFTP